MTKFVVDNGKNLFQAYDAAETDAMIGQIIEQYKQDYNLDAFINLLGVPVESQNYNCSEKISINAGDYVLLKNVSAGPSSLAIAYYDSTETFISGLNNIEGDLFITSFPENTAFIRLGSENDRAFAGYVLNNKSLTEFCEKLTIAPEKTTFFAGINYFNLARTKFYNDRFINAGGRIIVDNDSCSISFPVEPNTNYIIYIPAGNRSLIAESENDDFSGGQYKTLIRQHSYDDGIMPFTTGATAKYVIIYFYAASNYDYETYKTQIILNKNKYYGDVTPFIPDEYLPANLKNPLNNTQVLIFGDSITECCTFTINESDETTAYTWDNPSNAYIDAGGNRIEFSMWPKIIKESRKCTEIRNYAMSGASYKTSSRTAGNERQNVQYQIDVALNDLNNPNNVFAVDNFEPDIVIFAFGTNDGAPNDTFDSAMNKTVLKSDGYTVDVDATLASLDETKFCESVRKAYLRIRKAFPMAQIYCVLPIQRSYDEIVGGDLHKYLKEMAERNGCIIIDGFANTGITREFNTYAGLGTYLKDGLHPNEKGQNLLARSIIKSLENNYCPFGNGFNN